MSYRHVLALPHVARLLTAASVSRLAEQMFGLALLLYVLARFGSPGFAGVVVFASMAPGLLVGPVAGAVLDRRGGAWAVTVDTIVSALLVAAMAIGATLGVLDAPLLLLLVAAYSLTTPLNLAGVRALIPRLVASDDLDRANAIDTSSWALVSVVGPLLVGLLVAVVAATATLAVVAALYATAAVLLFPLAAAHPRGAQAGSGAGMRALASESIAGVREVIRNPTLRGIAASYFLYQVSWGILVVAVPVIVLGAGVAADDGAATVGVLWAAAGVAGGIGALVVGRAQARGREPRLIALGTLVTALAIFPVMALIGLPGLALGLLAVGAVSGLVDVGVLTLRQRRTDPARLGRVLAVSISVNLLGAPVGSALGGALLGSSVLVALVVAAAAAALASVAAAVLLGGPAAARAVAD